MYRKSYFYSKIIDEHQKSLESAQKKRLVELVEANNFFLRLTLHFTYFQGKCQGWAISQENYDTLQQNYYYY